MTTVFEAWFKKYHDDACREYGGLDCTNPKGIAEEAWDAAEAHLRVVAPPVPEPRALLFTGADLKAAFMAGFESPETMGPSIVVNDAEECWTTYYDAIPLPTPTEATHTQPASDPVAWRNWLRGHEWSASRFYHGDATPCCPECDGWKDEGHAKGCGLAAMLAEPDSAQSVLGGCKYPRCACRVNLSTFDGCISATPQPASEPVARVNNEGFIVEVGDLPLAPGMELFATPQPAAKQAEPDKIDADRWRAFIGLEYELRAEWATNLSLAPILTMWVDNRIEFLRGEGSQP